MMSRRIYASIVMIFLVVFAMFMFVSVTSDLLSKVYVNERTGTGPSADAALLDAAFDESSGAVASGERRAAIIAPEDAGVLTEWCAYGKYAYRVYDALPPASDLAGYDVLLFGDGAVSSPDLAALEACADLGIPMVFAELPDYEALASDPDLADFFGISTCVSPSYAIDGVKIFADFFLSGERIYERGDDYGETDDMSVSIPYYRLRAGYELYAVAVLEDQAGIENEDLPSLLWRTHTGSSMVFCINGDVFRGERMLGVLTAFLSQSTDAYLYPVVNAQAIVLVNYPYFADENAEAMMDRYSRTARGLSSDILWPNIVKVVKNYGAKFNFFLAPQLNYSDAREPETGDVTRYWKDINLLSGAVGLSLSQVSDADLADVLARDEAFLKSVVPDYAFTAVYAGDFSGEAVCALIDSGEGGLLKSVSLILTDFSENRPIFRVSGGGALSVSVTQDGYLHESGDDIQMLALETALGISTQKVDLIRAFYPSGDLDDWSRLSRLWSEGNTFFSDFRAFDMVSVYDMEDRVRAFLALNYSYERDGEAIAVSIDHLSGEAYFVLRLSGEEVKAVTGGTFEHLTDTAYLIRATQKDVSIRVAATDTLAPPK
jgi:hypothetical protein